MTSGVPQKFDAAFIAGIDKLIEKAEAILCNINPYDQSAVSNEDIMLTEHQAWMDSASSVFKRYDLEKLLPLHFYSSAKISFPSAATGVITVGNAEHQQALLSFRKDLHNILESQINILKKIKAQYKELLKPIVIHIDKDGLVWKDDRDKYSLKFKDYKNTKRVQLLVLLQKNTRYTKTSTIMEKLEYKKIQTLSKEKIWINQKLKAALELPGDLIVSGDRTPSVGYRINPRFTIKIEQKHS